MRSPRKVALLNPPNILCYVRIAGSAVLVALAIQERRTAFAVLFVAVMLTDWIDGKIARRFGWASELGAKLDAIADKVVYAALLASAFWLAPDALRSELPWILAALVLYATTVLFTFVKFRAFASYHTLSSKAGWFLIGVGALLVYTEVSVWPFRAAMALVIWSSIEMGIITWLLPEPAVDVPTIQDALWVRRMKGEGEPVTVRRHRVEGREEREEGAPLRILHVSDLHFGWPFIPEVGAAVLRAAEQLSPDAIVASGDITQRATREQFEEARAWFARMPDVPVVLVPGNHDVALGRLVERFFRPHEIYREYLSDELDTAWELPGAVVVALDSTSPRRAVTNGRIHLRQLDFVRRALRDVPPEKARIIVAHHHFAPAPDFEPDQTMPKAKRALDLFVKLRVDMILGGHLHRGYIGNSLDVYPGEDRSHGIIIVQCGTTTSRRGRAKEAEKNSLNLIEIDREAIRVSHHMYFAEHDEFRPSDRHLFPRAGRRHLDGERLPGE